MENRVKVRVGPRMGSHKKTEYWLDPAGNIECCSYRKEEAGGSLIRNCSKQNHQDYVKNMRGIKENLIKVKML